MSISTMRAVRVERPERASLVEVEYPRPGRDEATIRVGATGICGSDLELLHGTRPAAYVRYPIVPGHEWAGTVAELGSGVGGLAVGDRVVAEGFRACGRCDRCKEGRTNLCTAGYAETGFTHPGAFAEFVRVPARLVHRLGPDTDLAAAALLEPAACVAQGLLEVDLRPGLRVAVVGAGTLGLIAVMLLRQVSPARLALFGTRRHRLEMASELGCGDVVDIGSRGDAFGEHEDAFDLVFEAANGPLAAPGALRLARRGGTVILEGITGVAAPTVSGDQLPLKHLRVQGVFGASGQAWRWVARLLDEGRLDLARLVTHRFPLDRFDEAYATLEDRQAPAIKVQLVP